MVLAVQKAVETLVSLLRFVLTLAMPLPRQYGTLVFITFAAIVVATACFGYYMLRVARARTRAPLDGDGFKSDGEVGVAMSAGGRAVVMTEADFGEKQQLNRNNGEQERELPVPVPAVGDLRQTQEAINSSKPVIMRSGAGAVETGDRNESALRDSGTAVESPRATDPLELPDRPDPEAAPAASSPEADQQQPPQSEREPLFQTASDAAQR